MRNASFGSFCVAAAMCLAACGDDGAGSRDAGMDGGSSAGSGGAAGDSGTAGHGGNAGDGGQNGTSDDGGMDASSDAGRSDARMPDASDEATCPEGVAGEPPDDYLTVFESGTRLRARVLRAEGTMPDVFAGFYDTQLEVACDFVRASDGAWRCLPRQAAASHIEGYVDAQCTRQLLRTSAVCATQNGYRRSRTECPNTYQVRELQSVTDTTPRFASGSCEALEDVEPAEDLFAASEPLDPESFVQGTLRELAGVCEASVRIMEGEDGSRAVFELFDVATGLGCRAREGRCAPSDVVAGDPTLYADDACNEPAVFGTSGTPPQCRVPALIAPAMEDGYRHVEGIYEGEVYSDVGGCVPAREQAWITTLYAPGDALPQDALASFSGTMQGTERLQVQVLSEAGEPLVTGTRPTRLELYDTQLATACRPQPFDDGVWRCVPSDWIRAGIENDEFNDAACTEPIRRCSGDDCAERMRVEQALDASDCVTQAPVSHIWRLREQASGDVYRIDSQGTCYGPTGTAQADMWLVDEVDPSQLATLELQALP